MGCGASTTVKDSNKISSPQSNKRIERNDTDQRIRNGSQWPDQRNTNIINDNHENNENQQPAAGQQRNGQLNNMFYNDDYYVQMAMQESLANPENPDNRNEDEVFNDIIKDALVMSKKEYDDIDRKAKEDEIQQIKDNPDLMKKKIENLLDKDKIAPANKKLPPLEMINKNMKTSKLKRKKNLESVKAPILRQHPTESVLITDNVNSKNEVNDTDSEIDIRGIHKFENDEAVPSYNPQLLKDQKAKIRQNVINDNQFLSLESQEFGANDSIPKFGKPENSEYLNDNKAGHLNDNDDEYQNLINYLEDDDDDKNRNKYSAQQSTLDLNYRPNENKNKLNSKDSFDDLIDDLNIDDDPAKSGNFAPKVHKQATPINNGNMDDFDF